MHPQAHPPPRKSGPPIALLVGGGCGVIAVLGVIVLVVAVVVLGSSGSASAQDSEGPTEVASPTEDDASGGGANPADADEDVMDGAVYKRIPSTKVEVPVPPGWREDRRSLYSFALSDDGDAMLAFTTVSSIGEFNGRLQHAEKVFRITNCTMEPATRVRIGPNQLRGRLKEGDCTFNGVRAHVATVLVEAGRSAHPLVLYAVDKNASARTRKQAGQTIVRMRMR